MNPTPKIDDDFASLPTDSKLRHEALVNFFGQHLFWCRRQTSEFTERAVSSPEVRQRLGQIPAEPYARVSELPEAARAASLELARASVDRFMQLVLALLTSGGGANRLGKEHAIRYKMIVEIIERKDFQIVLEEVINRDGEKVFFGYFGRWLNRDQQSANTPEAAATPDAEARSSPHAAPPQSPPPATNPPITAPAERGRFTWPKDLSDCAALARSMFISKCVEKARYWIDWGSHLMTRRQPDTPYARSWSAVAREDREFREVFSTLDERQRGKALELISRCVHGAVFSTLCAIDQFPHGQAEIIVREGVDGPSGRSFPIAPTNIDLHDEFVREFSAPPAADGHD